VFLPSKISQFMKLVIRPSYWESILQT